MHSKNLTIKMKIIIFGKMCKTNAKKYGKMCEIHLKTQKNVFFLLNGLYVHSSGLKIGGLLIFYIL